jgi:hypothetical protein
MKRGRTRESNLALLFATRSNIIQLFSLGVLVDSALYKIKLKKRARVFV